MPAELVIYFVAILIELLIWLGPLWSFRKYLAALAVLLTAVSSGLLITLSTTLLGLSFLLVFAYRLFHLLRLVRNTTNERLLKRSGWRTSLWLIFAQLVLLYFSYILSVQNDSILPVLAWMQLTVAVIMLVSTAASISTFKRHSKADHRQNNLPTVSVAIPARNEDEQLISAIGEHLKSQYPKLEILVYDDCSFERSGEQLRPYAQKGIKFINGTDPREGWVAKNYAYQQLFKHASGEFIMFAGVDCLFAPDSIDKLVTLVLKNQNTMASVLPYRRSAKALDKLIQPMRYWWELSALRFLTRLPPCLSTCWIIKRDTLLKLGGFSAVENSIRPEHYFARETAKYGGYGFYLSKNILGIETNKSVRQQLATAVRTRYPQLRKKPERVAMQTFLEAYLMFGALALSALGFFMELGVLWPLSLLSLVCYWLTNILILNISNKPNFWSFVNFPFVILAELFLVNYSAWKYEFSEVIWRGRNVCLPVLQNFKQLPKI